MARIPRRIRFIIGIDEAGRGPIAGPVAVGAVMFGAEEYKRYKRSKKRLPSGIDSKKLTEKKREEWFVILKEMKTNDEIDFAVSFSYPRHIDTWGIVPSVNGAISRALRQFKVERDECLILLDGGLYAPKSFIYQETIIKGDEKEPIIGLASIAAKVMRDRKMTRLDKRYPEYNFSRHKGYGTKQHKKSIRQHGASPLHRRSFIRA
jgi:ribonuclease HII